MNAHCTVTDGVFEQSIRSAEFSGWDAKGEFFVELADVEIGESGDVSARLYRQVASGSLIFIRPVDPRGSENSERGLPVAHETEATNTSDAVGRYRIRFIPCRHHVHGHYGDQKTTSRI
jgi:hypothetical protein